MSGQEKLINFEKVKLDRIIDESSLTKSITFQGTYENQPVVIRLEKAPFDEKTTAASINSPELTVERNLINDIYSRYKLTPTMGAVNDLKAIVVWPANETVLTKYSRNETVFFSESVETYEQVVKPFIVDMLTNQSDYNRWVFNILDGKSESNHVILNDSDPDSGFMLLPSLKSSGDEKELHVIALSCRRDIPSMRDLNASHLPLLENILEKGSKTIREKYSSNKGQLRSYIHYHPTFYHFHVHFELVNPSEYKSSDRDNLLTTVINNIKLVGDYYQRATLTYPLSEGSALYKELLNKGCLDKSHISD